ncbi:DUF3237 domain-containing protein [Burkholderia sp. Ax-1719]|uniref:DUF3237 domain-containing protein n=1 Tax=Burkholderia sp. Ax-1719 TaxID=2608334 RepID=UPI0014247683|nr:DUF3237 domain-containing protein [Burkholderia sp. Ax-1719]NIE64218.1 DUF3237 domain-containing protein [Burkholderia sp. Ax-1719]
MKISNPMKCIVAALPVVLASVTGSAAEAPAQHVPTAQLVMEITCDLAPTMSLGTSPIGERRMVPIVGGSFSGPDIHGVVLAGGADRQLVRQDGFKQLSATYELKTDDGAVISVSNHVLAPAQRAPGQAVFSNIDLVAPQGKYGWINNDVYVGTLDSLKPGRDAVLIRIYKLQ